MSFMDYEKYYEAAGVKVHTVYSNHSHTKTLLSRQQKEIMKNLKMKSLTPLRFNSNQPLNPAEVTNLTSKLKGSLPGACSMQNRPKKRFD